MKAVVQKDISEKRDVVWDWTLIWNCMGLEF